MGETREWGSREEVGFETRDGVQSALKRSGDSSIFLRAWLCPACQVSDQALQSPLLLHVLRTGGETEAGEKGGKDPVLGLPATNSRGGKRSATSSTPFASLTSSCRHLLGR